MLPLKSIVEDKLLIQILQSSEMSFVFKKRGHATTRPRCHNRSWQKFCLRLHVAMLPCGYTATTLNFWNRQFRKILVHFFQNLSLTNLSSWCDDNLWMEQMYTSFIYSLYKATCTICCNFLHILRYQFWI